jgi:exopolysaccharide biosynthesis protein
VRQVVVRAGVVRSNRTRLAAGDPIRGRLLIGKGNGADRLRKLKVGQKVRIAWALDRGPVRAAVSGSEQILRDGKVVAATSRELHPRTAVGIDADRNIVHLVVVDGRSESSSGMTLVQLAQLLQSLGDESAINLDGGGSSEMMALNRNGRLGIRNSPSDGSERSVPVGLAFTYQAPTG